MAPATTTATISTGLLDNSTESGGAGESKEDMFATIKDKFFNEIQKIPCEYPRGMRGWGEARVSERPCGQGRRGRVGSANGMRLAACLDFRMGYLGSPFRNGGECGLALIKGTRVLYAPVSRGGGKFLKSLENYQNLKPKENEKSQNGSYN